MRGIILLSHGSVLCGSEQTLLAIAARMRRRREFAGMPVEVAFLNYSEPRFHEAAARCAAAGATDIVIVPYFLIAGKFVTEELQSLVREARETNPAMTFRVAEALRVHSALADAIVACAGRALPPHSWRGADEQVREFCRNSPKCPLHGGALCPSSSVEAGVSL